MQEVSRELGKYSLSVLQEGKLFFIKYLKLEMGPMLFLVTKKLFFVNFVRGKNIPHQIVEIRDKYSYFLGY